VSEQHRPSMPALNIPLPVSETDQVRSLIQRREVSIAGVAVAASCAAIVAMAALRSISLVGWIERDDEWYQIVVLGVEAVVVAVAVALVARSRSTELRREIARRERAEGALRASEARYRSLVEHLPAVVYLADYADGQPTKYVSPQMESLLAHSRDDFLADPMLWLRTVHPDDRAAVMAEADRCSATGDPFQFEYRKVGRDGRVVWVRDEAVLIRDDQGKPLYWQGINLDVTVQRIAEAERWASEERFRAAFVHAPIGMALVGEDGRWLQVNRALCDLLGYTESELLATTWKAVTHPDDLTGPVLQERFANHDDATFHVEKRYLRKDGQVVWALVNFAFVRDDAGRARYAICQILDMTARKALEAELWHLALHDSLTGLPNRALFADRLAYALAQRRRDDLVAVLFLDLDRFKLVNDTLGHDAGDRLLVAAAERLSRCLRQEDTLARFGGDEFAVLLDGLEAPEEATRVAERLTVALREPIFLDGQETFVGVSIGVAFGRPVISRPEELLRHADLALYRTKANGRASYTVFDPSMHDQTARILELETDLRHALERGELILHYQPIVDLVSGRIAGTEALVRWQHPTRGLVGPADFIALAEETGLIAPLGAWVLKEACRQAARWQPSTATEPPFIVSVNLSARQFRSPDLADDVARVLRETGLPPAALQLELTERVLVEEETAALTVLRALKALGVRLAVDDFGTGYSSLGYLRHLPVDALKIDRSFVRGLETDPGCAAIVDAITALARALTIDVTAEGIETKEQLRQLREAGCAWGQGYLFGAPVPHDAFVHDLDRDRTGSPVPSFATAAD
jgi:diguanylate cyclase (GGDEF)-like protein/PAS domain S-box-containing protein